MRSVSGRRRGVTERQSMAAELADLATGRSQPGQSSNDAGRRAGSVALGVAGVPGERHEHLALPGTCDWSVDLFSLIGRWGQKESGTTTYRFQPGQGLFKPVPATTLLISTPTERCQTSQRAEDHGLGGDDGGNCFGVSQNDCFFFRSRSQHERHLQFAFFVVRYRHCGTSREATEIKGKASASVLVVRKCPAIDHKQSPAYLFGQPSPQ